MWMNIFIIISLVLASEVLAGVTETYLQNVFNQPEYQFMVHDCETYVPRDRIEEITIAEWGLLICLHNTFDYSIVYVQMVNATTTEEMMVPIERLCKRRVRIQRCIHQFLEKMAPCSPPSVTVQVANMKLTVTDLISYFCRDDSANVRRFLDEGGKQCITENNQQVEDYSIIMEDLFRDFPIDTGSLEAINSCRTYDSRTSCKLKVLAGCQHPSPAEFFSDIYTLFRKGTYCRTVLPKPADKFNEKENQEKSNKK